MSQATSLTPAPEEKVSTDIPNTDALPHVPRLTRNEAESLRLYKLKKERTSAILVTILIHMLILLGLALWGLGVLEHETPTIQTRLLPPSENDIDKPTVQTESLQQKPSSPSQSANMISTAVTEASVFVPEVTLQNEMLDIGSATHLGMGFGNLGVGGDDGKEGFANLPSGMKGRCTLEERIKRLKEGGGNQECEDAVVKSLIWLQLNQNEDGSWGRSKTAAMTGLSLLSYLGRCETPRSAQFGDTVMKGIVYLVDQGMKNDGYLVAKRQGHHWVYEHSIGIYALSEAYAFTSEMKMDIPNLQEVIEKGVGHIINGQHSSGGWDYNYDRIGKRGGDVSVTGWQIQALKAAKNAGYGKKFGTEKILMKSVDSALTYIENMQNNEGTIGYSKKPAKGKVHYELQGVGALSYLIFDREGPVVKHALKVAEDTPLDYNSSSANLYGWYYTTQAMFFQGGSDWKHWNKKWRDEIISNQEPDGTWKAEGSKGPKSSSAAGADAQIYRNCLCTLMLEVYYRFLPGTGS